MRIFITGNLGYVGSMLTPYLKKTYDDIQIIGFDSGFFAHCLTGAECNPERGVALQYFGDIRDINELHLREVDSVIHLAGVSNDPIGTQFEKITHDINRQQSVRLAKMASKVGVKNFVFASSCSMYGQAGSAPRREDDPTMPLTAYARSKIGTEEDLREVDLGEMVVTSLRFATACGWSARVRLDLVLNDFVACAVTSKKITVLSDGTPWRPLIDVEDMSRALAWAMMRSQEVGGRFLAVNAGSNNCNYQVKELAESVSKVIPGTEIAVNKDAPPDLRSYSVDFSLFEKLAPSHQPIVTLADSITRLYEGLSRINFLDENFRSSRLIRLNVLREHIHAHRLSAELRWNEKYTDINA